MKKLLLLAALLWSAGASAQFTPGQVLTAAELNNTFAQYAPLAGATFTGPVAATSLSASGTVSGVGFSNLLSPYLLSATAASTYAPIASPSLTGTTTAAALTVTGNFAPNSGIVGVGSGSNASAGIVGEYLTSTTAGVTMTSSTPLNVTALTLSAGDWDVTGEMAFGAAGATSVSQIYVGMNTTSATLPAVPLYSADYTVSTVGAQFTRLLPPQRFNVTGSTTVNCVAQAVFGGGTMTGTCRLDARRRR